MRVAEPAPLGRQGLHKILALLRVKSKTLPLAVCLLAATSLCGCIPEYMEPDEGVLSTSSGARSDVINGQPSPTIASISPNAQPPESSISCVSIGWPVEEVSRVAGFALTQVENIPDGCSYRTEAAPFTTMVEISRRQTPRHASFEGAFARLSASAGANGACSWESPKHLAFTCTGTFGETQSFEGASTSMIFLDDHAVLTMIGTYDPSFVPRAEVGAWELAQEARARKL